MNATTFPRYTVADGVATITVTAANGFKHSIRVPSDGSGNYGTDALAFLKLCWPFEVVGSKRKKLKLNGVDLAQGWAKYVYRDHDTDGKVRCKDHDWLNWVAGNIFIHIPSAEERQRKQATAEKRASYMAAKMSPAGLEILQTRLYGRDLISIPYGTDPEVAAIFRESQMVPARPASAKTPALDTQSFNKKYYASDIAFQRRRQRQS